MRMELALTPAAASPHRARRFVSHLLEEWGLAEEHLSEARRERETLRDTALLLVSELVTNAVIHAGSAVELVVTSHPCRGRGHIEEGTLLRVEVYDTSAEKPTLYHVSPQAESGRGLALVEALADRWGVVPAREGKGVWFELCA